MQARYQHGELKIRKRKKGPDVWQFRWYDEYGRRKAAIVGTTTHLPTKAAAERAVEKLRLKINSELPRTRLCPVTMNTLLDKYFDEVAAHEVRKQTQKSYRSYAKHIRKQWGSETLHPVDDPIAIEDWLKTIPRGTAPHVRNFFHVLFQWARRWKYIDANPITLVRTSRKRDKIPRVLRPEEVQARLGALEEPYKTMAQVCCYLGLRACELVALQWGDFDWQAQILLVQRSVVQGQVILP
jgi:integrase